MSVTRSRLRAHAIEWHVAPPSQVEAGRRHHFLQLQRRCNADFCRHPALVHNAWLAALAHEGVSQRAVLASLGQLAILLRQLVLARERHTLMLGEHGSGQWPQEGEGGAAVVVCFDGAGVPWCPPLPGIGMGDPYVLSERLHGWWSAWQKQFPFLAHQDWGLRAAWPATRALCDLIDRDYNESCFSTALGAMLALENGLSTDLWQRLGASLRQHCEAGGTALPDAGFFPVLETHARLQARHGLYLLEAVSLGDQLDEAEFFRAGMAMLGQLEQFWTALGEAVSVRH